MKLALFAALAAAPALFLAAAPAAAAPPGSYLDSCRDVREDGPRRDPQLSAQCRDTRGRFRPTSLRYRGCRGDIGNEDGRLVCDGRSGGGGWGGGNGGGWGGGGRLPGGSWTQSCSRGTMDGRTFTARCDDGRGRKAFSSINLRRCPTGNVGNRYGQLVCQ